MNADVVSITFAVEQDGEYESLFMQNFYAHTPILPSNGDAIYLEDGEVEYTVEDRIFTYCGYNDQARRNEIDIVIVVSPAPNPVGPRPEV